MAVENEVFAKVNDELLYGIVTNQFGKFEEVSKYKVENLVDDENQGKVDATADVMITTESSTVSNENQTNDRDIQVADDMDLEYGTCVEKNRDAQEPSPSAKERVTKKKDKSIKVRT